MQARMKNPAIVLPEAMDAIQRLYKAMSRGGVPQQTLELVHLRASQINGCSACVYAGSTSAKKAGETDERLFALPAWRESPFFTEAERAALALTEAATRLSDRGDQVPDDIWKAAADLYSERELAAIILMIATANFFNRINATIRSRPARVGVERQRSRPSRYIAEPAIGDQRSIVGTACAPCVAIRLGGMIAHRPRSERFGVR